MDLDLKEQQEESIDLGRLASIMWERKKVIGGIIAGLMIDKVCCCLSTVLCRYKAHKILVQGVGLVFWSK